MTAILAAALSPILKVLGKAAGKLAVKIHSGPCHRLAEKWRKELETAAKVILVACLLSCSGCTACKWLFVATHDSIDEVLNEQKQTAP